MISFTSRKINKLFRKQLTLFNFQLNFKISSNKFYQIAQQTQKQQILYKIPEQNIITRYLKQDNRSAANQQEQKQKTFASKHYSSKNSSNNIVSTKLKSINYKNILANNSKGSIINKKYRNNDLCLMGMNYRNLNYDSIYKTIMKFQPDCILIQTKPDHFNQQFQIIKKNPLTDIFSDRLYAYQLELNNAFDLKVKFNNQNLKRLQSNIFPRKASNKNDSNNHFSFFPFLQKEIVCQKPLLSSIYYSLKNNIPIYLGQLPQSTYRQWVCNKNSLMQLQQLFKITAKSLPLYPGINLTPYQLASYLFSDQFLAINDKYMATLVQIMMSLGYKRIMVLSGVAQNEAIWNILQNSLHADNQGNIVPLINYLIAQKVKGSIVRDYDTLELIQKHILFDALYHGVDLKDVKTKDFKTTNKIVNHYAKDQPKQMIFKFRYQMCLKYMDILRQNIIQGQEIKKKEFMRQAIRYS